MILWWYGPSGSGGLHPLIGRPGCVTPATQQKLMHAVLPARRRLSVAFQEPGSDGHQLGPELRRVQHLESGPVAGEFHGGLVAVGKADIDRDTAVGNGLVNR